MLDEIDYLVTRKQSVIYNMFDWATSAGSSLVIVGISNTMDLPERLLPRVHSRLGIRRINFLPYSYEDIATIIHDRLGDLSAFHADGLELCCRKVPPPPRQRARASTRLRLTRADAPSLSALVGRPSPRRVPPPASPTLAPPAPSQSPLPSSDLMVDLKI